MDITLIWFPLLKAFVTLGLIYGVIYFIRRKFYKVAGWYGFILIMFWIFMPIKYDGTNSVERHQVTQQMRTADYKSVTSDATVVHVKKLTFDERMALEAQRSKEANERISNEIIK